MAPRKPLTTVSANAPLPPRRQTAGKKAKEGLIAGKNENDALKAQIADLTSQLEDAKIAPAKTQTISADKKNPFGGSLPTQISFQYAGVAPKRPHTAFQCFSKDKREELKASLPEATVHEVNAKLGEMWKSASEQEQTTYNASVEEDRRRYAKEVEAFKKQKEKVETERLAIEYWTHEVKMEKAMEFYEAHLAKQKEQARKSGPVAPKQARNAYHLFSSDRHRELAKDNVSLGEAASKVAEEWKNLQTSKSKKSSTKLRKYQGMAAEDETRYEQELEEYQTKLTEVSAMEAQEREDFKKTAVEAYAKKMQGESDVKAYRKLQAENKEAAKLERKIVREEKKAARAAKADEPKRPGNAYTFFFSDNATGVTAYLQENKVEHSMAREIADRWKALKPQQKKKYEKMAEQDRKRYEKEMEEYKAK